MHAWELEIGLNKIEETTFQCFSIPADPTGFSLSMSSQPLNPKSEIRKINNLNQAIIHKGQYFRFRWKWILWFWACVSWECLRQKLLDMALDLWPQNCQVLQNALMNLFVLNKTFWGRQIKRGYKDIMGQFGSDGYLYDFAKRSAREHMGSFGSDGYLYDFAKVNIQCSFF